MRRLWLIIAITAAGAYALPLLSVVITGAQYLLIANESIAYRYFLSVRILGGEGAGAWLPQGQLVTLLQHGIVLCLTKMAGMSQADIEHTLQPFGLASCAVMTALGAALLVYGMMSRRFTTQDKILVALAALVPIFVTRANGFYYSELPDYYFMTMVLSLAYVVLFIHLERKKGVLRWQNALWLGIFCGVSLANKITLVCLAGIVAAQVAIRAYRVGCRHALLCISTFGAAAVIGFLAVFLGVYLGHVRDVIEVLQKWYVFGVNAGQEPGFEQFIRGLFIGYNYHLVLLGFAVTLLLSIAVIATDKNRQRSRLLLLGAIGAATAFVAYAVYRRPAGTTLYEAAVILTAQAAMALAMLPPTPVVKRYTVLLGSSAIVYSLFTFNYDLNRDGIAQSRRTADMAWEIHAATREIHGPWVLLIPDNSYGWAGVEELIVKGTSSFPTWYDAAGAKWIRDLVAPGLIFRSWPDLDDGNKVFVWITKADDGVHFVENSLAEVDHRASWVALEARAAEPGSRCQIWTPTAARRVKLCVLASPLASEKASGGGS